MYTLVRNFLLFASLTWITNQFVVSTTNTLLVSITLTIAILLTETLVRLSKHQSNYTKLRNKVSGLDSFDDDGEHLPSLYNYLKKISANLKDRKVYLGDNRNLFERPYRFINDTYLIIEKILSEVKYIDAVAPNAFKNNDVVLFTNSRLDRNKKYRWEFYLKNISNDAVRDEIYEKYVQKFGQPNFKVQTAQEIKQIAEREERLKNLPNHLEKDFFKEKVGM